MTLLMIFDGRYDTLLNYNLNHWLITILHSKQIDIWRYPLNQIIPHARDLLSQDEQARADRFHFSRHRQHFINAHAVLRVLLSHYLKAPPQSLRFACNQHGKPDLIHFTHLKFNLSHSGHQALLAVGLETPLGVDLEFFSSRPYEGIGEHIFSVQENQSLRRLPGMLKPLGFFHLWAQKEALIKACGLGLSYPTKQFDLPLFPTTPVQLHDPVLQKNWQITSFMPEIACCAAVCYDPRITEIRHLTANPKDLLA